MEWDGLGKGLQEYIVPTAAGMGWLGKGQGHEHGECDAASRRVSEYDLDEVLVGAECSPRAGAGAGRGVH